VRRGSGIREAAISRLGQRHFLGSALLGGESGLAHDMPRIEAVRTLPRSSGHVGNRQTGGYRQHLREGVLWTSAP